MLALPAPPLPGQSRPALGNSAGRQSDLHLKQESVHLSVYLRPPLGETHEGLGRGLRRLFWPQALRFCSFPLSLFVWQALYDREEAVRRGRLGFGFAH